MELIHKILNFLAAIITLNALIFFSPPYLIFKILHFVLRSVFPENVAGKVVVIAGASSGIGEHLAYEYARRGAYLVLAARREKSLEEVAERANRLGSPYVITIRADVSKVEDCQLLIHEAINHFGQLNHLVNNASVTPLSMFEDVNDITNFAPSMDINFWGSIYTTYFAIPHLKRSKGRIIVIASSGSWLNAPRLSFYNASKAAVVSFYETLRVELLRSDIGITIVTPGLTESEMTKGKFLGKSGEMEVDQEMRDVELSVVPIEPVEKSAKAMVNSVCRGDNYLTEPSWMRTTFYYNQFLPEVIEWFSRWLLITKPGKSPTQALGKIILDQTGLKTILYPDSLLSPEIKLN
ncbi:PREDICTED: 11-beta-hydroxysteroid dehydrogenase 1B-like [Ipomoea nil]|uniref:11-beta-hydroxysteroid dehydrogenase 1B-like n=1 Tax=Ipomoea nil TaxID=35883 RepID=UPI0009011306|nr:PREDICTED: 11-beta-hydroxysteroid dehydrogenase 1B-like [Ipomoea nil]